MITVAQKVEELVNQSPYIREGIVNKLINLSELARQLKPRIEKELYKEVTEASIFMALHRYSLRLQSFASANPGHYLGDLSLRSDLFEVTVLNSFTLAGALSSLLESFQYDRAQLFVFTQGLHETTIIASTSLESTIMRAMAKETVKSRLSGLTAISLQRLHDHLEAVGVLMYPLRILAWQGISVIEIVTTLNELMIIIKDENVDHAFVAVRQALSTAAAGRVE